MIELMQAIETTPSKKTGKLLSPKTVKHYHTILKNMFNDAVALKILSENPMDNVPVETPSHKVRDNYYTIEESTKLLVLLANEPIKYQLGILLAISTGARLGEISGLQWKHIDVSARTVLIEQVNSYAFKESKIKEMPKTESSFRKVSIPPSILPILEEHKANELVKKEHLKDKWFYGYDNPPEEDFIFTQRNGKMMYVKTLSQWFLKFRRKHNLKDVTFHGLRHTSTVAMVVSGINVTNISSKLGHAKTSTTQDIYSHAVMDVEKESANIFEGMIQNAQNEESGTQTGTNDNKLRIVK